MELRRRENVAFVLQEGPGIRDSLAELELDIEPEESEDSRPAIQYHPAGDVHGEVFALQEVVRGIKRFTQRDLFVLPAPDTLFPVIQHVLPMAGDRFNISMGYPLVRTPLFALRYTHIVPFSKKAMQRSLSPVVTRSGKKSSGPVPKSV